MTEPTKEELKPCPFCGAPATLPYKQGDEFRVIGCSNDKDCGFYVVVEDTDDNTDAALIRRWNIRRPSSPAVQTEDLKEALACADAKDIDTFRPEWKQRFMTTLAAAVRSSEAARRKLEAALCDGASFLDSALVHGPLPGTPWNEGAHKMVAQMKAVAQSKEPRTVNQCGRPIYTPTTSWPCARPEGHLGGCGIKIFPDDETKEPRTEEGNGRR